MNKIWVLKSEDGELLALPNIIKGEMLKRLIGVTSQRVYSYALIAEETTTIENITNQMMKLFRNASAERQIAEQERIKFLLDAINDTNFQQAVLNKSKDNTPTGLVLLPMLKYSTITFNFKTRKIIEKPIQVTQKIRITRNKKIPKKITNQKTKTINVDKILIEKAKNKVNTIRKETKKVIEKITK